MASVNTWERLKQTYRTGKTRSYAWRIAQLKAIKRLVQENEAMLSAALKLDLGRSEFEAVVLDIMPIMGEVDHILAELDLWMKPEPTRVPSVMLPATSEITTEPMGVVLVIGPFNYPIQLALSPLMGAICAGNCVVFKPSEISMACEKVLAELIPKYLDNDCIAVVCGGIDVSSSLLNDVKWDKIFFTGSTRVGKIVMKAAAENLTPVLLELGGKSPTIIDESVENLELAAKRTIWGKFANAGQTCIAPDYVLVHEKHHDVFVQLCAKLLLDFYGSDPKSSPDFGRVINKAATHRLLGLLSDAPGTVVSGGKGSPDDCYLEPTIVTNVKMDSALMQDEIFGPILPIVKYSSMEDAIKIVRRFDKPLAMYIFAKSRFNIDKFMEALPSGGVTVNDTLMHCANCFFPFGGLGQSGLGSYHGKYSYLAFSHSRSVLRKDDHTVFDVTARYPPFSKLKLNIFRYGFKVPPLPLLGEWVYPLIIAGATWSLSKWWYAKVQA